MSWKLNEPLLMNFEDIWCSRECTLGSGDLFGTSSYSRVKGKTWYVRESYVKLYDDIVDDRERTIQIVNGTAGIGKSCFLLYVLARCLKDKKSVLLYIHRNEQDTPTAVYFNKYNHCTDSIRMNDPRWSNQFRDWYRIIDAENSFLLVDGIASFPRDDVSRTTHILARSAGCSLRSMENHPMRRDRWLECWSRTELIDYARQSGIPNATETIDTNLSHIGGVCRYAFVPNAGRDAILSAVEWIGATEFFKFVDQNPTDRQKVRAFERLIHRHPPADKTGNFGTKLAYASEFAETTVAHALALESRIQPAER